MMRRLACLLLMIAAVRVEAAAIPGTGIGDVDGPVHAMAVFNRVLYLGGSFTTVYHRNGTAHVRNGLAAINLVTGEVTGWDPGVTGTVHALAISPDGRTVYIGGNFSQIGTTARSHLAAVEAAGNGTLLNWAPGPDGPVRALALAPDGQTLYVGGSFTTLAAGTVVRRNLAAVDAVTGVVHPWVADADGAVEALLLAGDERLYVGGAFSLIAGQLRPYLARLNRASGQADTWNPAPDGVVRAMAAGVGRLYIGGDFTAVDGGAPGSRKFAAALDPAASTPGSLVTAWNPDFNGTVRALALSADGAVLYAGGDFTTVNGGTPRDRLAAVLTGPASADLTAWDPGADQAVRIMLAESEGGQLLVGGDFTDIASDPSPDPRTGLAMFAIGPPVTRADPAPGGYQSAQSVTLSCEDNGGGACSAVYFTTDGSEPQAIPAQLYSGPIAIGADTLLKFFGVDGEGNVEVVRTAAYFIDNTPPVVSASLPGGAYGSADLQPVTLQCDDGGGSGCDRIYFTDDGTPPTTASLVYAVPLELDLLLGSGAGQLTLRFFAEDNAGNRSAEAQVVYDLDLVPPLVFASLPDGTYPAPQTVSLRCDDGPGTGCAVMYYTTDGSAPSDGTVRDVQGNLIPPSPVYTEPLVLSSATMLNVLVIDNAGNRNTVIAGIYAFTREEDRERTAGAMPLWFSGVLLLWYAGRRCRYRFSAGSGAWR